MGAFADLSYGNLLHLFEWSEERGLDCDDTPPDTELRDHLAAACLITRNLNWSYVRRVGSKVMDLRQNCETL